MKDKLINVALFVGALFLTIYFRPQTDDNHYVYEVSRPWIYPLLTAPFDIPVHLDSISARLVKDSIDTHFEPIFKRDAAVELAVEDEFVRRMRHSAPVVNQLKRLYGRGIVDQMTYARIRQGQLPTVRYIIDNAAIPASTRGYVSEREAYSKLDSTMRANKIQSELTAVELAALVRPNITYDSVESNRILAQMYQKAMAPIGVVQQGERIIDQGEIVTPQLDQVLRTFEHMQAERNHGTVSGHYYPVIGQALYVVILLAALYAYLFFFRRDYFSNVRVMTFLMVMLTLFTLITFAMNVAMTNGIYVMPLTILPIMVLIFCDSRTAMFIFMVEVLLCATIAMAPLEFVMLEFIAGVAAITSIRELSKRSHLVRTALAVFICYALGYIAVEVMHIGTVEHIDMSMFAAFGFNALLISFAYFLIFIFEKIFGFTSKVTLVELSDINNPLLRELSDECPGTFQHAMAVSSLASAAAAKIGANVQLVRAGALYHDIGKLTSPSFFTENQHGVNPHDMMSSPERSAAVIIRHVTDGLRLADKYKLPAVIKDFISEHHGQGLTGYFYAKACADAPEGTTVDPAPYTYPGPNPQSRETSLMMMADAVEAASRSLTDHSDAAIRNLVDKIIDGQINAGLHSDSPISFKEIKIVKATFIARLSTIYHSRVAYPDASKQKE